jgi:glycosyltransferase involved in cell wall biosynthesis
MQTRAEENSTLWLLWITENDIRTSFNMAPRLEVTREMRKLGWKVDLVACGPEGKHEVQGVEVMCFPRQDVFLLSSILFHLLIVHYILGNWRQINAVLFNQLSAPWILPLRLIGIFSRQRPLFVMDTRTIPMEPPDKATWKEKFRGAFLLLMNKMANRFADGQTAITSRMARHLNIPQKQLWGVWSSGVNKQRFAGAASKRIWPEPDDPVILTYIGTLNYERNLMALCHAVREANHRGMNFHLWLYGEGNEKQELQEFSRESADCIQVFDTVPNVQVPEILAQAHVGVLPFPDEAKYRVCSPIKLFEYMGSGMPILATSVVCHTDVIGKGEYVFWADQADASGILAALEKTWTARACLPGMGLKSLSAAQDWTWDRSAQRLDKALRRGLEGNNGLRSGQKGP